MTNVVPFDTLALASALRDEAGLDQQQAEGFARVLSRALVGDMATKADLGEAKAELKAEIGIVRADLRETETRLDGKIEATRLGLEARIAEAKADLTKTILSAVVVNTALVLGAMFGLAKLLGH